MSKIEIPEPEDDGAGDLPEAPSVSLMRRELQQSIALQTWVESAGDMEKVREACGLVTREEATKLVAEAHDAWRESLGAKAEATLVRHQYILGLMEALIAKEVAAGNLMMGITGLRVLERNAKMMGIDKEKAGTQITTFRIDMRMPDERDEVIEGQAVEVVETDITPRIEGA